MKRTHPRRANKAAGRAAASSRFQALDALELSRVASSGRLFLGGLKLARAAAERKQTVVLVEGVSDALALSALAKRFNKDLDDEGITIVAMGGATNIRSFLNLLGPHGLNAKTAGLCDLREEHCFQRALEAAGFGLILTRSDMEALGFYVCTADLEDELIRSLGVDSVLKVVAAQDELEAFRTFQKQQAWQARAEEAQLRRWLGVKTLRKFRYATLLVHALNLDRVPNSLKRLLAHVSSPEDTSPDL